MEKCVWILMLIISTLLALSQHAWTQPSARQDAFQVERLTINHRDCTTYGGLPDVDALENGLSPSSSAKPSSITVEIAFQIRDRRILPEGLRINCTGKGGIAGFPHFPLQSVEWNKECSFDPATGRGIFRFKKYPLVQSTVHTFTLANADSQNPSPQNLYGFTIQSYPSLGRSGLAAFPFYILKEMPRQDWLAWPPAVYSGTNHEVAPNTSLFFQLPEKPLFWGSDAPVSSKLRIFLVEMDETGDPFRPLHIQAQLPTGREKLIYDGPAGRWAESFSGQMRRQEGQVQIWIHSLPQDGAKASPAKYLKPSTAYSVQFTLEEEPYKGNRYEATRFTVRTERRDGHCVLEADYESPDFIDWQGNWFNGHLFPANNVPSPYWGEDFLLRKQMRDQYPDLWRTAHFQYVTNAILPTPTANFSGLFNDYVNLYRDRSIRAILKVEQTSEKEATVTLGHIIGAENFHDPDNQDDRISSHPVVANGVEAVFTDGDPVILQAHGRPSPVWEGTLIPQLEARVKEVRPEANQLVLETQGKLWPVEPEGASRAYPAVLGAPGSAATSITLAAEYKGTYLRLRNGKPFVNWAILNHAFDFFVHTMGMRVSIERYSPPEFTGDALLGNPSAQGWQAVHDCEYYLMRHLLRRYKAGLDTFLHPIFGEGKWALGRSNYMAFYDTVADGILRAYEEVLGVRGEDYRQIAIGLGGLMFQWHMDDTLRMVLAHVVPAPLETLFPPTAPAQTPFFTPPENPLGSNPLYFLTQREREEFAANQWQFNACFLNENRQPILAEKDWDASGRLTTETLTRLLPEWKRSRWLLQNTRRGKGSPFRMVNLEGYGYTAEQLAKCILFEKELLAKANENLRAGAEDPMVRSFLHGVSCGTIQLGLYDWRAAGDTPLGRPFQGTGYWPAYFADLMRRILEETARQPQESRQHIYRHGTFLYDTFIGPDTDHIGTDSDTALFATSRNEIIETRPLGEGKEIKVLANAATLEKDVRHLVRFVGMMTHRLAGLPQQKIQGHTISAILSKGAKDRMPSPETGSTLEDRGRLYVLAYDHYVPDLESNDPLVIPLTIQVRNLPPSVHHAKVMAYIVDRDHSSLASASEHFEKKDSAAKNPRIYTEAEIQALREAASLQAYTECPQQGKVIRVTDGKCALEATLRANRLLLFVLDWNEAALANS